MDEQQFGEREREIALVVTTGPIMPQELVARLGDLGLLTLERQLDVAAASVVEQFAPTLIVVLTDAEHQPTRHLSEIVARSNRPLVAMVEGDRRVTQALVAWLDAGADLAYVTSDSAALVAGGIAALLRRYRGAMYHVDDGTPGSELTMFTSGNVTIDLRRRRVMRDDVEVAVTRMEFQVLQVLVEHADTVCSVTNIATAVYARAFVPSSSAESIRTCISRLRRKLEADPQSPQIIRGARGFGYVIRS